MSGVTLTPVRDGQIRYAHFLHLNSVVVPRDRQSEPDAQGNYVYAVKGKPRPMIVIGPNGKKTGEFQWYWVVKLTTAGADPKARATRGLVPLGRLLDKRTVSYAECRLYSYPENLFDGEVLKDLGPPDLTNVLRITRIIPGPPLR